MKLLLLFVLLTSFLFADETSEKKRYGYSYLAIGMQHTYYIQEFTSDNGNYKLKSKSYSPYYTTATLTRVNQKFGFEIYAASTLFASSTDEYLSSASTQTQHTLDMTLTDVAFTLHYKPFNEYHRFTMGGRYTYEVLKRYHIDSPNVQINSINNTTTSIIENKIAAITLDVGYMYMNKIETGTKGINYRLGASFGIPFFSATADTYADDSFKLNPTWGSKVAANGYIGYTVFNGLEVGAYLDLLYQAKFDDIQGTDPNGNYIKSKDSIKTLVNYGVLAAWSF